MQASKAFIVYAKDRKVNGTIHILVRELTSQIELEKMEWGVAQIPTESELEVAKAIENGTFKEE